MSLIITADDNIENDETGISPVPRPRPILDVQQKEVTPVREYREIELPDITLNDLSPEYRKLVGDNIMLAKQQIAFAPDAIGTDLTRSALRDMELARKISGPSPSEVRILSEAAQKVGMSEDEFRFWMTNDPKRVEGMILDRDVLDRSGMRGYVSNAMRTAKGAEELREDARALAAAEAWMLGTWETGLSGAARRAWYDTRVGFGQVGVFGAKGMAGLSQAVHDFVKDTEEGRKAEYPSGSILGGVMSAQRWLEDETAFAADWWGEKAKDADAEWLGPEISTGNPVMDYVRSSAFRGMPFIGGSIALAYAFAPFSGAAGGAAAMEFGAKAAAAVIGAGMGGETYGNLRADGISPGTALAAASFTGTISYLTNRFTLGNITRYLGGRSPMKLFSVGTLAEVGAEGAQEFAENIAQTTSESLARLLEKPEYTAADFWADMSRGVKDGSSEAGAVAVPTALLRIIGLPVAIRNQGRVNSFANAFSRSGEAAAETELFKSSPEVLAGQLNAMAAHNGGGPVWTSVEELTQAGVTKEQATLPVAEGGLGVTPGDYDHATATGEDIAVGYGNALVFSQKQKQAGNAAAEGAFSSDPDSMSVGDIRAMRAEAEALVTEAETYYQEEVKGEPGGTPNRLKIFKAGLRAVGYDREQAAALTAMFRAGADRNAQLSGITPEEWLESRDVQLQFNQALLASGRKEANRYIKLLEESRKRYDAEEIGEATTAPEIAIQEAAQPGISELTQPAVGEGDNQAWINEATENIVNTLGLQGEQFAPLRNAIQQAMTEGVNNPDVRAIAERLGIELPELVRTADVVEINSSALVDQNGNPIDVKNTGELRRWLLEQFEGRLVTIADDGTIQEFTRDNLKASLKRRGIKQRQAYAQLDSLLEHAVYDGFETADAKHPGVSGQNIYYVAAKMGDKYYSIRFKIDMPLDEAKPSYKDHKVTEIEIAPALYAESNPPAALPEGNPGAINKVSIPVLKGDVKPSTIIIDTLYQGEPSQRRGAIAFPSEAGAPITIKLLEGTDVSTVVHELNHLFVRDLSSMVKAGLGGETAKAHLDALTKFSGGALDRAGMEKIASAWERYVMEGVAPSAALEEPFSVIRKYVSRVYRNALDNLVEPSPEVRRVFDALLATDAEIEEAARRRELREDWSKAGTAGEKAKRRMDDINARRDDRTRRRRDAGIGGGREMRNESNVDALAGSVKDGLSKQPVYRAVAAAKAKGGMNRDNAVAAIGEAAVKRIEEKHGADVFGDGVSAPEVAARAGYSIDASTDMLSDMAAAENIDTMAELEARERQRTADALEDISDVERDANEGVEEEVTGERDAESAAAADMAEEVEAAIEDEVTDGGKDESLSRMRELQRLLREWRETRAALKSLANERVAAMPMRRAVDIRSFRSARSRARRNAFAAASRGDRAALTRWKKQEMYHQFTIDASMRARELRDRLESQYSPSALKGTIDAAEHGAKIELAYAQGIADLALYSGLADSRYLRGMAGENANSPTLILPAEDPELGGLIVDIADTLPDWLLNKEKPEGFRDFRDFTVEQLTEIDRLMRWLIDNGRGKLNALNDLDAANMDELISKSIMPMERRENMESTSGRDARTLWGKTLNGINRFLISATIPENWFMAMDGNPTIQGKGIGINHKLFRRMVDADVYRQLIYEERTEVLKNDFEALNNEKKAWEKKVGGRFASIEGLPVPEVMKRNRNIRTWDFDTLLSICLYMGNDAGLRRLLTDAEFDMRFGTKVTPEGGQDMTKPRYNFTNAQLKIIESQFSEAAWNAIQNIWNSGDHLYELSDKVTYNLTNRHVKKETGTPLDVTDSDGKTIRISGGYFPLVNDPMLSVRASELNERTTIEDLIRTGLMNNINGAAKRSPGAIRERARADDGTPLVTLPQILSTSIITQHIDTMAHYIAYAEVLRDVDRMTRDTRWRSMYEGKFGAEQYNAIRRWVKSLAAPERGSNSPGERFAERMRNLATINALGLRWKTGLKQRLGAFQAAAFMSDNSRTGGSGWNWLWTGAKELGTRGNIGLQSEKVDFVNEKSKFMRARSGGFDREIRDMRNRLSPLHRELFGMSAGDMQNLMFWWIQANDQGMAYAVWLGAYRQGLAGAANFDIAEIYDRMIREGKTETDVNNEIERRAVEYADTAAATQASSFAADLTEIQRDRGFMRFMSMFMSGNVRQGSRLMQYMDALSMGDKTKGDVAWLAVREYILPSLAWVFMRAVILYAASEALGIGGDDEDPLVETFWESLETSAAPWPLLREAPRVARYGVLAGDVPAVKATARAGTDLVGAGKKLTEGEYMLAVGKAMDAAGYAFGIPVMNLLNDFGVSEAAGLKPEKKRSKK